MNVILVSCKHPTRLKLSSSQGCWTTCSEAKEQWCPGFMKAVQTQTSMSGFVYMRPSAIGNMDFEFSSNVVSSKQRWHMSFIQQNYHLTVSSAFPCLWFLLYLLQISLFLPDSSVSSICLLLPPTILKNHSFPVLFIPSSTQPTRKPPKAALKPNG